MVERKGRTGRELRKGGRRKRSVKYRAKNEIEEKAIKEINKGRREKVKWD